MKAALVSISDDITCSPSSYLTSILDEIEDIIEYARAYVLSDWK